MSFYSNVTERDLINLRKLAEYQKDQRALKIKNRILKQTHDIKSAGSLPPITKQLDEVKETTQKLGVVIKESQPETPQLVIKNTPTNQPIENDKGVLFDVELENTLKNMSDNNGFLKTYYDRERSWMVNGYPIKKLCGSESEIFHTKYNITPGNQKVSVDSNYKTAKSKSEIENLVFRDMLQKTIC